MREKVGAQDSDLLSALLRLVERFCRGCDHYSWRATELRRVCGVFNRPYPLWGKEEQCWARKGVVTPSSREIREVMREEQRRGSGAGGEKSDRTHKLFGRERMKDNKWKEKWSGFLDDPVEVEKTRRKIARREKKRQHGDNP